MLRRFSVGAVALATAVSLTASLHAQTANPPASSQPVKLPTISIAAKKRTPVKRVPPARPPQPIAARGTPPVGPAATPTPAPPSAAAAVFATPPVVQRFQLPTESFSTTAQQIEETVNIKDPEDAIKYFPSLFVRKRNDGDNQAVLATRTWGLNSSARTLIYMDDLLVSALIGNNNSGASPHWNLITPEAIERIDFLNGPYAAAYPGNSMGGVLLITTKMPDKPEVTTKQTISLQQWHQYDTRATYPSSETSATAGNRTGPFSWFISANHLDAYEQPLTYTTVGFGAAIPPGTTGLIPALNKQGVVANVIGTGQLVHTQQTAANFRVAYDLSSSVRAAYSLGIWNNMQDSTPESYLRTAAGAPTYGGAAGSSFAGSQYAWYQTQMSNAVSLKSDSHGLYDFDFSASSYNYLQDEMLNPFTVTGSGLGFSENGKITRNDGTNWQNADAKGIWRPLGFDGPQEISFGVHGDRYYLNNPTYGSAIWNDASSGNQVFSDGIGETRTGALWLQDAWKISSNVKLTLGGRLETWRAFDGFNFNSTQTENGSLSGATIGTSTATSQPELQSTNFSPKASLSYDVNKDWNVTTNFGEAYRYPTVSELYQNVTSGSTFVLPNPNLTPEQDLNGEIDIERHWTDGRIRLTAFYERTNNAIISQTNTVTAATGSQTTATTFSNVDAIRMQGIEASADKYDVWIRGLRLFGSVTYVDSRILKDPTWSGKNPLTGLPDAADGQRVPYVPDWRATAGFTYKPNDNWAWTVAARYSGKMYSTLDNTDIVPHVYGAFDKYLVVDTKIHYETTKNLSFDFGIDNLFNEQYFLFHPFPGRTYVMAGKYQF